MEEEFKQQVLIFGILAEKVANESHQVDLVEPSECQEKGGV